MKPKIVGKDGKVSSSVTKKNGGTSWEFPFPFPENIPSSMLVYENREPRDFRFSAVSYALMNATLIVVDYETFFPERCSGFKCECGEKLIRHGFHNYCRIERGNSKFRVFKTYDYIHRHCSLAQKEGRDSGVYNTLSPVITKQLTPQIVPHIDWVCNDGHILSASVVNDIVARMHMGGWSFDSETKASKEVITHKLAKMEELRLLHVKERRASLQKVEISDHPITDFYPLFSLSSKVLAAEFLQEMNRRMPLIQCSFRLSAVSSTIFQQDHNFPFFSTGSGFGTCACFHWFPVNMIPKLLFDGFE